MIRRNLTIFESLTSPIKPKERVSWGRGGTGFGLRKAAQEAVRTDYFSVLQFPHHKRLSGK